MKTFPNDKIVMHAIATFQSSYHRNLITNLSYTDLLLALLQVSTRVCVLSDSLVFRTACDDYYLEKQSCRRPQRAAELVAQLDAHWHTSVLERKLSCKDFEGLRPCRAPRKLNVACTALQYCCIGYCAACLRRA